MIENPKNCLGIFDKIEDCDSMYGGEAFVLTDKDIELLKQGKIINFSVNDEYGCTLRYEGDQTKTDVKTPACWHKTDKSIEACPHYYECYESCNPIPYHPLDQVLDEAPEGCPYKKKEENNVK